MTIYDRSQWPSPEDNPLVRMLLGSQDWFSNEELVAALGLSPGRALLSHGTIFKNQIDDADAAIVSRGWLIPRCIDQYPCAHWRSPSDMMRQG